MTRITSILLVLALAVSIAVVPLAVADLGAPESDSVAAGSVQTDDRHDDDRQTDDRQTDDRQTDNRQDDAEMEPGEQLAGVVGVQQAELNGELAERAYGIRVASAQTDADRAGVASDQLTDVNDRLDELERLRADLDSAYENGEISYGEYRSQVAVATAEQRILEQLATDATTTVEQLDDGSLEDRNDSLEGHDDPLEDYDLDEIRSEADRAADVDTPDASEITQSVAGDSVGQAFETESDGTEWEETDSVAGSSSMLDGDEENVTGVDPD
ncbi:hypothetical protein [Natrarchaeobius chitinivorans]|uniref:hypothetical protein n=1 Tax=Natrarchaeobius chitinivorans TaxID=1679083 RepID=UPI000F546599|nr:hypothetical protein [Natrarchaeobius chitinivorans]